MMNFRNQPPAVWWFLGVVAVLVILALAGYLSGVWEQLPQ